MILAVGLELLWSGLSLKKSNMRFILTILVILFFSTAMLGDVYAVENEINTNYYEGQIELAKNKITNAELEESIIIFEDILNVKIISDSTQSKILTLDNLKIDIQKNIIDINKESNNTTIQKNIPLLLEANNKSNLEDMALILNRISSSSNAELDPEAISFLEDINKLNINQKIEYYENIDSINEDSRMLLELATELRYLDSKIINSDLNNLDSLNKVYMGYENFKGNTVYLSIKDSLFQRSEDNWIENRANFFNKLYKESLDIEKIRQSNSGIFSNLSEDIDYTKTINDLDSLKKDIYKLKLESDKEILLLSTIDQKIDEIKIVENKQLDNKKNAIILIVIFLIAGILIILGLLYIFVLSKKKERPVTYNTSSKSSDGRTLYIFESKKFGTSAHPKELDVYANSDVGLKRELNEDSIGISFSRDGSKSLYVLADGMGGHNAGEVASKLAIQTVIEEGKKELLNAQNLNDGEIKDILRNIVYTAHERILAKSKVNPEMFEMGTTLEAVFLNKGHMYYAHVGDSRIYMTYLEDDCEECIKRVTADHSELGMYMERYGVTEAEARTKVPSNVITQAVGITATPLNPDIGDFSIGKNNWILLCSDGLSDMVQDDSLIGKIIIQRDLDVKGKVNELIRIAKEMGGKDNISIILLRRR